jgi:hypothetical protein
LHHQEVLKELANFTPSPLPAPLHILSPVRLAVNAQLTLGFHHLLTHAASILTHLHAPVLHQVLKDLKKMSNHQMGINTLSRKKDYKLRYIFQTITHTHPKFIFPHVLSGQDS